MRRFVCGVLLLAVLAGPTAAKTESDADANARAAQAIEARLEQWTRDFNDKRKDEVCDLFSRNAISEFRGQPERSYEQICGLLKRSLSDPDKTYRYHLHIREILVFGDVAVVRLTWTLHIKPLDVTSVEPGMDVFRKEADGKWRIVRYVAYEAP